jgi:hypothetical protein
MQYMIRSLSVEVNVLNIWISEFGKMFKTHTGMHIIFISVKLFYASDIINSFIFRTQSITYFIY